MHISITNEGDMKDIFTNLLKKRFNLILDAKLQSFGLKT